MHRGLQVFRHVRLYCRLLVVSLRSGADWHVILKVHPHWTAQAQGQMPLQLTDVG